MKFPPISFVVPVYNGEQTIRELHNRINQLSKELELTHELIFVEDCGGDNSWRLIKKMSTTDDRVKGIRFSRNFGQHNAVLCGIRAAQGDVIVTLDDDLQNPPEEIPKLLSKLQEGYDVVYGAPLNETHGFFRNIASLITKIVLSHAMGAKTAANVSAFRVFRSKLREAFDQYKGPLVNIDVLLTWGTSNFTDVKVKQNTRSAGESGYTLGKLVRHAFNMITGFSTLPLKIASLLGFFFSAFGFFILAYVVFRYLITGSSVPGFPFIASIIAIFSGAQLFALGILGEYLARMHLHTMDKPAFIISEYSRSFTESNNGR